LKSGTRSGNSIDLRVSVDCTSLHIPRVLNPLRNMDITSTKVKALLGRGQDRWVPKLRNNTLSKNLHHRPGSFRNGGLNGSLVGGRGRASPDRMIIG
jgi:hypothetical protein